MTTLITGGTGFIGAEIVKMLLDRGEGPIHVAHRSGNLGRLNAWTSGGGECTSKLYHVRVPLAWTGRRVLIWRLCR